MNICTFEGRVSGQPVERTLPSGDAIVIFRLVVPRKGEPRIDTIDCVVRTARLRKRTLALPDGAEVHAEGVLQRRFWRGLAGPVSRYEVVVDTLRRM